MAVCPWSPEAHLASGSGENDVEIQFIDVDNLTFDLY